MFWWDFLIGDTPEIFIGIVVVLGIVALLGKGSSVQPFALAVLVIATVFVSVWVEFSRKVKASKK